MSRKIGIEGLEFRRPESKSFLFLYSLNPFYIVSYFIEWHVWQIIRPLFQKNVPHKNVNGNEFVNLCQRVKFFLKHRDLKKKSEDLQIYM